MGKINSICCVLLVAISLSVANADAAVAGAISPQPTVRQAVESVLNVTDFTLQDLELPATADAPFFTIVSIDGVDMTLELYPYSIRSDRFKLLIQDDTGAFVQVDPPTPRTFRGTLSELPDTAVAASLLESGLFASIAMADGTTLTIQPLSTLIDAPAGSTHVTYRRAVSSHPWLCGLDVALPPSDIVDAGGGQQGGIAGSGIMATDLGIDADWDFFRLRNSNVGTTVADIESVMNSVNIVYERDIEVLFEITSILVRTSQAENPYTSNNNNVLLNQFQNDWNNNHDDIQRDVAHLFTGRNIDGNIIGTANGIGNICRNSFSFAQSLFGGSFSLRVALSAHEIGHNYNGFHCNQTNPPHNPCNIMCSGLGGCSGVGLPNFGPWNITRLVSHRNSRNCLFQIKPARTLPFTEAFTTTNLNRRKWSYQKGTAINTSAVNPPSPDFTIDLDTANPGDQFDDELRSNFILMAGQSDVILQYWTEERGAEAGEELIVEYRTNARSWQELSRITSDGVDQTEFVLHQHRLRNNNAYHDRFRLRFRTEVDQRNDDFFIDNIRLAADPFFRVSIESVGVTELPVTVSPNSLNGMSDGVTPFGRNYVLDSPLRLTAPADHQALTFLEWRIDGVRATGDLTLVTTVTAAVTAEAVYGDSCDPCDMNCDGAINAFDIEPFLGILFNGDPQCVPDCTGDTNGDGSVDAFDIEPFLNCLFP